MSAGRCKTVQLHKITLCAKWCKIVHNALNCIKCKTVQISAKMAFALGFGVVHECKECIPPLGGDVPLHLRTTLHQKNSLIEKKL